ncbi:uncharacterized protein LOC110855867 [Folsomia candida]|uniref:Peptidase C45 hydrolase domain-containing protein n=1 Tax=Folsomia candida TaxID=158441 RepID=A0A226DQ63_FOLCA|nr:uncharacterized protein LOC110855867 [Folsomia candida]OXA46807.1 hypothetical protein Fcan01_18498 [Folsomia candida]
MERCNNERARLNQIPVLYVRGDNFTVGYTIGRQFRSLIEDNLSKSDYFLQSLLPEYETVTGKELYQRNLDLCENKFPEYVKEIKGMAEGANIPFYKLFLLNLEVFITSPAEVWSKDDIKEGNGCSSILSNGKELVLGHTEDAGPELVNNVFIVSAEIVNSSGEKIEKFTTLTYAGCLPGYTMGFNEYGFIHSVNTLYPLRTLNNKSPRSFIARSLLKAGTLEEVVTLMKDKGTGIADGFSLNACFAKTPSGVPLLYNIEVCPNNDGDESEVNVLEIQHGGTYAHCNRYLRIQTTELPKASRSSVHRHKAIEKHPKPETLSVVREILSDRSDPDYPIFRNGDKLPDVVVTVAVGVFDIANRQWNIYTEQPNKSRPVAVLPLSF